VRREALVGRNAGVARVRVRRHEVLLLGVLFCEKPREQEK
jgi:hypothetical protein